MQRIVVGAFFFALVLLGLKIHGDYGASFDDLNQRFAGMVSAKYVLEQVKPSLVPEKQRDLPALAEFQDRDYGVAVEIPLVVAEALFRLTDKKDIFAVRHLLTFWLMVAGAFAVYRVAGRRFGDWRIGLLAALFLVLSPRVFAESFYNSKDGAFMAAFAIATATTISFVLRPSPSTALLHGLASAFAIDVRIVAVMLPLVATAILAVRLVKRELALGPTLRAAGLYWIALAAFVVTMWPWLWADPVGRFAEAFRNMANFRWGDNILYFGELIRAGQLPWHYLPVWIAITTPPLHVALFVVGALATLWQLTRNGFALWRNEEELQDLVFLGLFAAPIVAAIVLHSVVYDAWRQFYFVCPALVLVAVKGWVVLWRATTWRNIHRLALGLATAGSMLVTAAWMWRWHPLQNVYFNSLAGSDRRTRLEMDYWGMASRMALEKIVRQDKRPVIHVTTDSVSAVFEAINMLPAADRERVRYAKWDPSADYLLTNWRFSDIGRNTDQTEARYAKDYDPLFNIDVDGETIMSVFKRKPR